MKLISFLVIIALIAHCFASHNDPGFVKLSAKTFKRDKWINTLARAGADKVIDEYVEEGDFFSNSDFDLANIVSVSRKILKGKTLYKFNVLLEHDEDVYLDGDFMVDYRPSSKKNISQ